MLYFSTSAARIAASAAPSDSGTSSSTTSSAARTCSLLAPAISATAAHIAATSRSAPSLSTRSSRSTSTRPALATSLEARSSRGSIRSRSSADLRRAGLINRVAISSANRSSASSIASASRLRVTASSVAVRRGSTNRSSAGALLPAPYLDRVFIRRTGTFDTATRPSPKAARLFTRCSARTISVPDVRLGACRSFSNSEIRDPSGTTSRSDNAAGRCGSARRTCLATTVYMRTSARSRTPPTSRSSTVTPGSSTRCRRSHATDCSNNATGPSACVHARPCRKVRNWRVSCRSLQLLVSSKVW